MSTYAKPRRTPDDELARLDQILERRRPDLLAAPIEWRRELAALLSQFPVFFEHSRDAAENFVIAAIERLSPHRREAR